MQFGRDPARESFVFVSDLPTAEAKALLLDAFGRKADAAGKAVDGGKAGLTESEMDEVFEKIGTNPAMLKRLVRRVPEECTLQEFIQDQLEQAELELLTFPFPPILAALKESPGGVDISSFPYHGNGYLAGMKMCIPKVVGDAMTYQPIVYNAALRQYER
jgi:hypothetical protein